MTVSGISANDHAYQANIQSRFTQRQQDFQSLADALQAGNLQGAQQAFATLQKDRSSGQNVAGVSGTQPSTPSHPLRTDFQALQSAVQSGDVSGAQQALTTFQHDLQQAGQAHHHRHHHGGGGTPQQTIANFVSSLYSGSSSNAASSGSTTLNVTV